jgi:hypothetical protein
VVGHPVPAPGIEEGALLGLRIVAALSALGDAEEGGVPLAGLLLLEGFLPEVAEDPAEGFDLLVRDGDGFEVEEGRGASRENRISDGCRVRRWMRRAVREP